MSTRPDLVDHIPRCGGTMPLDRAHVTEIVSKHIHESGKLLSNHITDLAVAEIGQLDQYRDVSVSIARTMCHDIFLKLYEDKKIARIDSFWVFINGETLYPTLREGYG